MPLLALTYMLLGIALGLPASSLRTTLGDPLLVEPISKISRTADYLRSDDASGVLRVTERDGVVFAVEVERERAEAAPGSSDAHGVRLGMSRAAVVAKRGKAAFETVNTALYPEDPGQGASILYRFDGDALESIKLIGSGSSAAGAASLAPLSEATGETYATAVLDVSPSVSGSDHFRDRYLQVHGCAASGRSSTVDRRNTQTFVIATATCNAKRRIFYFDITRARP